MSDQTRCTLAVIGAGAAGLAAAGVASAAGVQTIVFEARDRVGGRIFTRNEPGLAVPIELGAEFVHGLPQSSLAVLRAAGSALIDTGDASFVYENGALHDGIDTFSIVGDVMRRARGLREDISIDAFTASLTDRERRYTRLLVQGFDAADPAIASARAILDEWRNGETGQMSRGFRPEGGYAPMIRTLRARLDPTCVRVLQGTPVRAIVHDDDGVTIEANDPSGERVRVRADAAIVTLPVGVLREGSVAFEPALSDVKRVALDHLVMGPVLKLVLTFRTAFWEEVAGHRYRDASFFQHPEGAFPTFWNLVPQRAALLVAWAGGPKADALASLDEPALVARALEQLRTLFGPDANPQDQLEAAYLHDWQRDPYARGAYSYVAVGGDDARAALAERQGALLFAGEATSISGEAGTVAGALETGERAAREALDRNVRVR